MDRHALLDDPGKPFRHLHALDLVQRQQIVLPGAGRRVLGLDAADHLVEHRAAGVEIRPGALAAAGMVLLLRRVAVLQDDCEIFFLVQGKFPGRAEVDKRQRPIQPGQR